MNLQNIKKVLGAMGCTRIREKTEWVDAECPLAPWTHDGGKDKHPSFGIAINEEGSSRFTCFSCKTKGSDLKYLLWRYEELSGKQLSEEIHKLVSEDVVDFSKEGLLDYDLFVPERKEHTLPEEFWDSFKGSVPKYLLNRGITMETAKAWGLGHDKERKRLMFAVRNGHGELVSMIGRRLKSNSREPKYWSLSGGKKGRYLYGEWKILSGKDYVIVTEGTMDTLWVYQNGFQSVVAVLGSTLTDDQVKTLVRWNKSVYLFFDNDLAGINGMVKAIKKLDGQVPVYVMGLNGKSEPTDYTEEELEFAFQNAQFGTTWLKPAETFLKREKEEKKRKKEAKQKRQKETLEK